ncbi:MAG TPA: helix-turn-helix domain-containing protein [Blastocatellia bacterium]|nr:helix-turn-helix domain-containing protein [Blastocatellia bacterium]
MTTRKRTEITIETDRLVVFSKRRVSMVWWCCACRQRRKMLTVDDAAAAAGVTSRTIYRWVESERLHFTETSEGRLLICGQSLESAVQLIDALPPDPCNEHPTRARMVLRISAERNGKVDFTRCLALSSPQAMRSFEITISSGVIAQTKVWVAIEDRLLGVKQKSLPQMTGLCGLSLPGCRNFLGRPGEIMCESQTSFNACENLKRNGVPVKCGMVGRFTPK